MRILDLGCGPGLYAEKLAEAGHKVTGVDFSERSISYAVNQAKNKALDIEYICQDYRTMEFKNEFDLVLLIYTDFGVLIPNERDTVLINIHNALKQNGLFIFDVINAENVEKKFEEKRNWNYESSGFWSDIPHLELSEGFHYPENKVFLQQHIIIDQKEKIKLYRFWTHYFEDRDISRILSDRGFINVKTYRDVLPSTNIWNGENISFYKSSKF
jgi:SAM-dependent methyltransferase